MTPAFLSGAVTVSVADTGAWIFFLLNRPLPDAATRAALAALLCARRDEATFDAATAAVIHSALRFGRLVSGAAAAASFFGPRRDIGDGFETRLEAGME